jgi:hypothetical protein
MGGSVTDLHGVQLPARYEIRRLEPQHEEWVSALTAHANIYQGWFGDLYDGQRAKIALRFGRNFLGNYRRTLKGGLAYGIFDKEYQFKRPESTTTGGALYWSEFDENDPNLELDGRKKLSDAMDFPLVSHAMAYDASDPECARVLFQSLGEEFPDMVYVFGAKPPGMPEHNNNEKPKRGEVIGRNGTATADGYTGKGLMKALAHFMMHEANANGYKKISIDNTSVAVHHVYSNPPAPYSANVLIEYHAQDHEVDVDGKKIKVFEKCNGVFRGTVHVYLSA